MTTKVSTELRGLRAKAALYDELVEQLADTERELEQAGGGGWVRCGPLTRRRFLHGFAVRRRGSSGPATGGPHVLKGEEAEACPTSIRARSARSASSR